MQGRAICGGSGHLCQMEPVAHFGLGHERKVEKVEVRWPDGTVAVVEGPKPCQTLVVRQPG
ncbi:ASPIC/UnbV domain-containing protein [Aerophototrophica crusticola]|uniref:ASPIC/UnbV domain-containing protein n=1 Tax=Aerophototrophica crusticola TaxID=1709002 RepID=UPI00384E4B35